MQPVIKAVCFDVGGVLTRPVASVFVERAAAARLDPHVLREVMWNAFAGEGDTDDPAHRLERGEITIEQFFAALGPAGEQARTLMDPGSVHFVPARFEADPTMHAFVREVRTLGYRTAIISNVVDEWLPWWEAVTPPVELFDVVVHSCTVGLRKPNPAIYEFALGALGIAPHEALYLDDFPAMAEAAAALGMITVHVTDHDTAVAEARRHLAAAA